MTEMTDKCKTGTELSYSSISAHRSSSLGSRWPTWTKSTSFFSFLKGQNTFITYVWKIQTVRGRSRWRCTCISPVCLWSASWAPRSSLLSIYAQSHPQWSRPPPLSHPVYVCRERTCQTYQWTCEYALRWFRLPYYTTKLLQHANWLRQQPEV